MNQHRDSHSIFLKYNSHIQCILKTHLAELYDKGHCITEIVVHDQYNPIGVISSGVELLMGK